LQKPEPFTATTLIDEPSIDTGLAEILRVSPEPLVQINDYAVHRLICDDLHSYLDYLHQGLQEVGSGATQLTLPPKQLFQQPDELGDFRIMPCVRTTADGAVHKTVKLVGTNRIGHQVPDQITVGKANYLDPKENFVSHQFDACLLSSIRTGAGAALASNYLLQADCDTKLTVTLVGAGRVGYYALRCLLASHPINHLQLCDPIPNRAANLATLFKKEWPDLKIVTSTYTELTPCDLLILATDSPEPIFNPEDFATKLVVSLGADCVAQRELHSHPQWREHPIYVDTPDSLSYGDLHAWNLQTRLPATQLIDLPRLSSIARDQQPLPTSHRSALFIGTGSALMDNLTMSYLVARLATA